MKILVTGGAGFIGSHLTDSLLRRRHKVVCVDDLSLGTLENIKHQFENKNFRFIKLDILDAGRLKEVFSKNRFDCVFHLAANSDIRGSLRAPSVDLEKTFLTTCNILTCMAHAGVKKIVFTSSSAVYGQSRGLLKENAGQLRPVSFYGAAKLASEAFISAFCQSHDAQAWILRLPNVAGQRATHGVVFDFMNQLRKNHKKLRILGDGNQKKPYVYVKDLVDAIIFTWRHSSEKLNYFNIGVASSTTVKRIARIVAQEMGYDKVKFIYAGGKTGWIGDTPKYAYDLAKINKLGWSAQMSSDVAIRHSAKAMLENNFKSKSK